ncbi:gamma-secretase-activating protein-like isoform X2 [Oncorhynchus masou masou]|uniref:gamma-secretase-activating protein-like isoform X2 n=1 Tax=Oncorhynchus masou masou TaxID=90313 RepID=UPI003183F1F9
MSNSLTCNEKSKSTVLWCSSADQKVVLLFQEEDSQQRALIGLMVDKLREHLNRHLPRLGKKKIDVLVVNYVAKLLELIRRMLESVWLKYKLGPLVLCLKQQGSSAEWTVFHVMCRILEATKTLCLPLPPDLDNSDANEELKFSIVKRLPESMEQRICHLWDHPISSACISRDYVRGLLEKHAKTKGSMFMERDEPGFRPEFLPLTFLTKILLDVEDRALNPFEEQENVDARFVEETALKQTLILMGFQDK